MKTKDFQGFAVRFDEARTAAGAPEAQEHLGRLFGVSGNTAWSWKNGRQLPSMNHALDIAVKFGVCVEWLLTGRGPKHPPISAKTDAVARKTAMLSDSNQRAVEALIDSLLQAESESRNAEQRSMSRSDLHADNQTLTAK